MLSLMLLGMVIPAAWGQGCRMPDNGNGTADFPPLCPYDSETEVIEVVEGFPPGSGLYFDGPMTGIHNADEVPGGTMGGTISFFDVFFEWEVTGFGEMDGFQRQLSMPVFLEVHTGPRNPGDPVQTFEQMICVMEGGIYGDPDFAYLLIKGGLNYGLPGPGMTTLTQLPSGDFAVDSFFDITYEIEFEGAPGSQLEGVIALDVGTIQMETERNEWDFGDAPDPTYPTWLNNNGARHWIDGACYMGNAIDGEFDGQPTGDALGDDNSGFVDDEDGINFNEPLIPGQAHIIDLVVTCDGFFNLWIDWDRDGGWIEPGDWVFMDLLLMAGPNVLTFNVPATAFVGNTFARARFCTYPGLEFIGPAEGGEVEDYMINIHSGEEWKMHFPQWPDLTEMGVDVYTEYPLTLADDFRCTRTGPITNFTIWCSWMYDEIIPDFTFFELSLWSDNPNGPGGYSEPEELLWSWMFFPGDYIEEQFAHVEPGEWWYNPWNGDCFWPADYWVWQYDFHVPEADAFFQEDGTIYWLSVTAHQPEDPGEYVSIGWKSSHLHWNDDAVWRIEDIPWQELRYPGQHPLEGQSMDLAFLIDGPAHLEPPHVWMELNLTTWSINWDPVPGAIGYKIYGAAEPYTPWPSALWMLEADTPLTSWTVPITSTKRFYRVVAYN